MVIKILPTVGIECDGNTIKLGMAKEEIISFLGEPASAAEPDNKTAKLYYFDNELRFDFNSSNELEFIEFLGGADGGLMPEIYGLSAFSVLADELAGVLAEKNSGAMIDDENGYSYAFPNIGIGVYRDALPEDVEEMAKEAKEDGEPLSDDDYQYEMSKAIHWATIGLGGKEYYR